MDLRGSALFAGTVGFLEVNLNPELGIATDLSGHLEVKGPLDAYRGQIRIVNKGKGWTEGKLSGEFQGGPPGVKISKLDAGWIDGTVQGSLAFSWARGLEAEGRLQGAGLNPARFHSEWKGNLNLKLEGRVLLAAGSALRSRLQSPFLGKPASRSPLHRGGAGRFGEGPLEDRPLAGAGTGV